jgi:predicted NBD/HSP70 family sugar kinase
MGAVLSTRLGASSSFLVFDIGGTTSRVGLYDSVRRRLTRSASVSSDKARVSGGTTDQQLDQFVACLELLAGQVLRPTDEIGAIVVGFPGPVTTNGVVLSAPTLWPGTDLKPLGLTQQLSRRCWGGTPLWVINDLTAAGYAYASQVHEPFCIVNVSSGVGHKIFVGQRPLLGANARGGEIGHVVVDSRPDAPLCDCGERGHLGAIASGRGVLRRAHERAIADHASFCASTAGRITGGQTAALTNEVIAECFRADDPWIAEVIKPGADHLGWMLALLRSAIGVDDFLLVGGFAQALGQRFCSDVATAMDASTWLLGPSEHRTVKLGNLGDDAGLLGAGHYASQALAWETAGRASKPPALTSIPKARQAVGPKGWQ